MQILDKSGVFVTSNANFGFCDPESGHYIDCADMFKVTPTGWLKAQIDAGVFSLVDDDAQPLKGDALAAALAMFPAAEPAAAPAAEPADAPAPAAAATAPAPAPKAAK